ncbi:hypothetical protein [Veillonella caviae]|nr:hypothetical protein [Veillonella caviae]MDY5481095.1 hypothetical protein [Veillonella caviae]
MLSFTVELPKDKMTTVRELNKVIDSISDEDEEQMRMYRDMQRTV